MLRKLILSLSLVCLPVCVSLAADIVELDSLANFYQEIGSFDENTLFLFDVDHTLIMPKDVIQRAAHADIRNKIIRDTFDEAEIFDKFSDTYFVSIFYNVREAMLVEDETPALVRSLQERKIPVLALTAAPGEKYGIIESLSDWRVRELKRFGFNFKKTAPSKEIILFSKNQDKPSRPLFKKGILFTANHPKGEVLANYLELIKWKPNKIVFVDDHIKFIASVEESASQLGIEFVGIHYRAIDKKKGRLNENVARLQYHYLAKNREWLSDKKAEEILKANEKK